MEREGSGQDYHMLSVTTGFNQGVSVLHLLHLSLACGHMTKSPPDEALLLRHPQMACGHSCQEARGATTLGTAHAHKVPRSHHIARRLCRHLMSH